MKPRAKPLEYDTHMLVGIGAVLFVVLGELFVTRFHQNDPNMRFDPIRIVEAVVTGISFLGAGTIFVSRGENQSVKGLTTAASILATAAVGMIVGLERYFLAIASTVIIFTVLRLVGLFDTKRFSGAEDESKS
ncbi:MAG: MgtC/SapB family protein [Acidobacteria bacterium]|nr:MgtC/SapB family protein [Acidobacteriota bacterium]MCA1637451.1 MgtC/SapB family protein [Acidobacteriota bacterium]